MADSRVGEGGFGMIRHMSTNIASLLGNYKGKSLAGIIEEDGKHLADKEARKVLAEALAAGWKKIPYGDCEGFDHFDKGCPGHPDEKEERQ